MERRAHRLCAALKAHLEGERLKVPEYEVPIWNAFAALSRARRASMAGPNPIAMTEIEVWCRLTRTPLEPHHVALVLAMDEVWLNHARSRSAGAPTGAKVLPPRSGQRMTAALFDLME